MLKVVELWKFLFYPRAGKAFQHNCSHPRTNDLLNDVGSKVCWSVVQPYFDRIQHHSAWQPKMLNMLHSTVSEWKCWTFLIEAFFEDNRTNTDHFENEQKITSDFVSPTQKDIGTGARRWLFCKQTGNDVCFCLSNGQGLATVAMIQNMLLGFTLILSN